ncbi:thiamine phosphate synthase [Ferrovibrio terrae]|uniref:thiamine phosphate synthase n=1 Tax=Ferrovibrio terrae TaxID=2594003 RepID=UPI0031378B36
MKSQVTSLGRTLATPASRRKPEAWPVRWLVTDARRLPDPLPAIRRLQSGDGVLFRHYELAPVRRLALARQIAALCRRQGLVLLVAGDVRLARAVHADGLHLPQGLIGRAAAARRTGLGQVTAAAHDAGAVRRAARAGVDAVLISPVFSTASHPGAAGLGALRFAALSMLARHLGLMVYALGGITAASARRLRHIPKKGTAAIQGMAAVR